MPKPRSGNLVTDGLSLGELLGRVQRSLSEVTGGKETGESVNEAKEDGRQEDRGRLRADTAGREARRLISAIIGVAPEAFLARPEMVVLPGDCEKIFDGVDKRRAGMPIGRIAGQREFYGRQFQLGPAILEPRADSEVLIDAALELIREDGLEDRPLRIIDVGTGSGCLLITLLAELPQAHGVGVDIEAAAIAIARGNAQRLGVSERAEFIVGNALGGVEGPFDVLVSNPPYLRREELAGLDAEVRLHDPVMALDGGVDGMDVYRLIANHVRGVVPKGWMLFEVGAGMADSVCHEIDRCSGDGASRSWRVWQDFNGHKRCVAARTQTSTSH